MSGKLAQLPGKHFRGRFEAVVRLGIVFLLPPGIARADGVLDDPGDEPVVGVMARSDSVPAPARGESMPENVSLEGFPLPGDAHRTALRPYLDYRPTTLQDWHPKRRDMLVLSRQGETPQLYEVRTPLGPRHPVTASGDRIGAGSYAPSSGDTIVYGADKGGDEFYQLFRVVDGRREGELLTDGRSRNTSPCWAASGGWLAYLSTRRNGRDTDLYVMDPRRPGTDRLVTELPGGGWSLLDWSPDERSVLMSATVSVTDSALYRVEVATGVRRRLTPETGGKSSNPGGAFLPDGRTALVITDQGAEHRYLARMDLATGRVERFGPDFGWSVEAFDLSSDGRTVVVSVNEDGRSVLRVFEVGSGREGRLPKVPAGVISDLRWHPGRREIGFTLSSAKAPNEAYSIDTRVLGLTRWTESGSGGKGSAGFAEPERMRVRSFDGREVSGWLYRPDAGRFPGPRPVVVHVHGGPEGQARPQFLRSWNYLVEEMGIALLYPNVRGSEGYGRSFLALDDGMRREDAVRDLGAFLDGLRGQSGLDAERVAVYGGSYGGYMVLASLMHFGDRLRCGIDVVGISDFVTFLRNTQDYRRDLRRAEYGDERDPAMAAFLERISPARQAARIGKPLLVVQGRNDPRVPATESEQMVKAIREQGGSVAYLVAEDEGHGFVRKRNADFMFLVVVEFLERHLLGEAGAVNATAGASGDAGKKR